MRRLVFCLGLVFASLAQAFDLAALEQQLQREPVTRGAFVQQKFLRGMQAPVLTSRGTFVLAAGQGLLWHLQVPLVQRLRITPAGVARAVDAGGSTTWHAAPQQGGGETRMLLPVLSGDTTALQKQFRLALSGTPQDWQLRLTPQNGLLQQIFEAIIIRGNPHVARIELLETQGDRTLLQFHEVRGSQSLDADEQQAFE